MKKKKILPKFKTREEAAKFWNSHSGADHLDALEEVELKMHPSIKKPRDLSPRCPNDDQVLLSRWRNLVIAGGFATLNKVRELYCPRGDYTRLAPETQMLVKRAEAALKRVQQKSEKLAA